MATQNGFMTRYGQRTCQGTRYNKARLALQPLATYMYISIQIMDRF